MKLGLALPEYVKMDRLTKKWVNVDGYFIKEIDADADIFADVLHNPICTHEIDSIQDVINKLGEYEDYMPLEKVKKFYDGITFFCPATCVWIRERMTFGEEQTMWRCIRGDRIEQAYAPLDLPVRFETEDKYPTCPWYVEDKKV